MNIQERISKLRRQITVGKCEKNIGIPVFISDLETLLTAYEKEKEKNRPQPDCAEPVERTEEMVNMNWVNYNYISKDKIKSKIEEVEQWKLYNMKIPKLSTLDERLGAKIGIKYVLQSLLEKE